MANEPTELTPEEVAEIKAMGRCEACGHLTALHHDDYRGPYCGVDDCMCEDGKVETTVRLAHEGFGVTAMLGWGSVGAAPYKPPAA